MPGLDLRDEARRDVEPPRELAQAQPEADALPAEVRAERRGDRRADRSRAGPSAHRAVCRAGQLGAASLNSGYARGSGNGAASAEASIRSSSACTSVGDRLQRLVAERRAELRRGDRERIALASSGRARPRAGTCPDRCASGRRTGTSAPRRTRARCRPRTRSVTASAASRTAVTSIPSTWLAGRPSDSARAMIEPPRDGLHRRVLAVAVVLADEHDRQVEHLREVEALEEVRLVRRAVAEVRDRDRAGALAARAPRRSRPRCCRRRSRSSRSGRDPGRRRSSSPHGRR